MGTSDHVTSAVVRPLCACTGAAPSSSRPAFVARRSSLRFLSFPFTSSRSVSLGFKKAKSSLNACCHIIKRMCVGWGGGGGGGGG